MNETRRLFTAIGVLIARISALLFPTLMVYFISGDVAYTVKCLMVTIATLTGMYVYKEVYLKREQEK